LHVPERKDSEDVCVMSIRELEAQAYQEWSGSTELQHRYHTFDYYWAERYARIYRLAVGIAPMRRQQRGDQRSVNRA
jgi:isocitrate/isopropylmalate dehydrogenase